MQGLALYGIDELLKKAPGLCKYYFVRGLIQDNIDANYLFSCMQPEYSEPGSSRRTLEEKVVDNFQDFLNSIEDTKVTGYSAPVAWNYKDEDEEKQKVPDTRHDTRGKVRNGRGECTWNDDVAHWSEGIYL